MNSVLVTGASTGFGMELSLTLAERGYRVYASMRDLTRRKRLDAAAMQRGVQLTVLGLDVTDQISIDAAIQQIIAESGQLYAIINNAGQILRGYFEDLTDAEIRALFETNFFGTMAVTRAAIPYMRVARSGRIVIISSVAGKIGAPSGSVYSASRFALEGFAESLYQELMPLGVYVTLIEPGITKTESWTVDRGSGSRTRNPNSPYYRWFMRAEHMFDKAMQTSPITTQAVANTVAHALAVPRPRLRYLIGRRARLVLTARRIMPSNWFDRLYFGLVMRQITGAK